MIDRRVILVVALVAVSCGGPERPPSSPEPAPPPSPVVEVPVEPADAGAPESPIAAEPPADDPPRPDEGRTTAEVEADPSELTAPFRLEDATEGLGGRGALFATIKTTEGDLRCKLLEKKAPVTVANFVGLARGKRAFKDPASGKIVKRPIYDGTTFHRVIRGFMIQGGDPLGTGTGEPGYVIADEIWKGAKHDRPGLLCMANRGPNTNGAQFFVTDAAAAHLDGNYTIFGECSPESVVHAIAGVPVVGSRPKSPVTITAVEVERAPK